MGFETILFLALGLTAIFSAAAMVYFKNAVHSALFLIINFGCVALLYLMLDAPFISMVQITVYAGAIMVLFLFVIMLLGAEQATDTGGSFKWLTWSATALAIVFLSVAVAMALLGLELPDAPGNDPLVRVVHAADVDDPVEIDITGDSLPKPLLLENIEFGDVTDFVTLPAGDYNVIITDASGATFEETLTVANDDIRTLIAYNDADTATLAFLNSATDLSATEPDSARLQVVNLLPDTGIVLVDLGRNNQLDAGDRAVIGDTDAGDEGFITFGTVTEAIDETEGVKTLAFYTTDDGEYVSLVRLSDWDVREGTSQLLIIAPDYSATTNSLGNYRPRVLDREQETLTVTAFSSFGHPVDIGNQLFTTYLLPVNLVGFLLLVALIGVIVLTRPAGLSGERRSTVNRRRKVSRPLVNVISQQTGQDVIVDVPRLPEPDNEE